VYARANRAKSSFVDSSTVVRWNTISCCWEENYWSIMVEVKKLFM